MAAPDPLRNTLVLHVRAAIQRHAMLARGQPLLVAVSGGLDSMVLLEVLHRLSPVNGWRLSVAHYNHQLRGRSSDADEALVVRTAQQLKIPVFLGRGDVRVFADKNGVSTEMAARTLRHEFFASTARRKAISTVALAHHAGDQAELFFLRLLRGTAIGGLAGMRAISPSPADSALRIIRPLLGVERASIERYADEVGVVFREDATNRSAAILRNRIRHELLPLLKLYQPAVEQTVARLMEIARAESTFVERAAKEWMSGARTDFEELDVALQRRCLAEELVLLGVDPDFELIESLRNAPERSVNVLGDKMLVLRKHSGTVEVCPETLEFNSKSTRIRMQSARGCIKFNSVRLNWSLLRGNALPAHPKKGCEFFDADRVGSEVCLRHWRKGDRFQPIGMAAPVKLQDFFTNTKIPRHQRVTLLVAEDSAGKIFWVEGCRISECHKVRSGTRHRLKWECRRFEPAVAAHIG